MKIILYSTHCPRCTVLKKKLELKKLPYEEFDDMEKMIDMGLKSVPALQVDDGKIMTFQEANEWIKMQEDHKN